MSLGERLRRLFRMFGLDSHHAIERLGVIFGVLAVLGVIVLSSAGAAAVVNNRTTLGDTALWTAKFTTSKTDLAGDVDGVFVSQDRTRVLVMMHFAERAKISYSAQDYQAFLLGSNQNLGTEPVATPGVTGSFHVFGSTGYVGVVLESDRPFDQQVLNLTMRANAELTFTEQREDGANPDELAGDSSFAKYDQWRVFFNPGANQAVVSPAMDAQPFDPASAFYEIVLRSQEEQARAALDSKLAEMRTNLTQIASYTADLAVTKVDELSLRPPTVPAPIAGDEVTGLSKAQAKDGTSTLALSTGTVFPGGWNFDWRSGNVFDGYLDRLKDPGESYVDYLQRKASEPTTTGNGVRDITWVLSNGKNLVTDYRNSDQTMRPLVTVMNNLSGAYQSYWTTKSEYQSKLMLDLLRLEVKVRDVRSNSSLNAGEEFLTLYR